MPLPPPLSELARDPSEAAILLDVDGTLAPIVVNPAESRVPEETRRELRRLVGRYALVGCVTGRPSEVAREIVGVDGIVYAGEHGLELDPEAERWVAELDRLVADASWPAERKRFTASFHYRTAEDEQAVVATLSKLADRARAAGLVARWGRKVLEVRPPVGADKGTALVHLLASRSLRRALFAGDDDTDLDGFGAMGELELGIKVAVDSAEGPPALREAAAVVVDGP
ncbi:MAG: trehalose-phosphatase, partial [Actinomycetota bacterium]|nr:trehalose-phosphatase [Actinomycetota bacterium]